MWSNNGELWDAFLPYGHFADMVVGTTPSEPGTNLSQVPIRSSGSNLHLGPLSVCSSPSYHVLRLRLTSPTSQSSTTTASCTAVLHSPARAACAEPTSAWTSTSRNWQSLLRNSHLMLLARRRRALLGMRMGVGACGARICET